MDHHLFETKLMHKLIWEWLLFLLTIDVFSVIYCRRICYESVISFKMKKIRSFLLVSLVIHSIPKTHTFVMALFLVIYMLRSYGHTIDGYHS